MKNLDNILWLFVAIMVGLIIVLGIIQDSKSPMRLPSNPTTIEVENYIKRYVQKYIENNLTQGEEYKPLKWKLLSYTDDFDRTTIFADGTFSILPLEWSDLCLSHTFIIKNQTGCESHYCKNIKFNKQGNITNYTNKISSADYTGVGLVTGFTQGPLRNSDNEELIIWGEDIIRDYIHRNIGTTRKYIPLEWILYTKLTLDEDVFDALDITFSPSKRISKFHPNWIYAALCIKHRYSIEGRDGYKETKHNVFIISPNGKVKEVSSFYFSMDKSAEEQYKLLFTNF